MSSVGSSLCRGLAVVRKRWITCEISGRCCGSWLQQSSARPHRSSVKPGWVGRSGRFPSKTSTAAAVDVLLWNGAIPVNTLCR